MAEIKFKTKEEIETENKILQALTPESKITTLGKQLTQEKLKNIQKDSTISQLGEELASLKLEVINMKGGN